MQSTANAPYIGTVDGAPQGGTCFSLSRLPFKGSQIIPTIYAYPETVSLRFSGECLWSYSYILCQYLQKFKCSLLHSLTEGVSDHKEEKDESYSTDIGNYIIYSHDRYPLPPGSSEEGGF